MHLVDNYRLVIEDTVFLNHATTTNGGAVEAQVATNPGSFARLTRVNFVGSSSNFGYGYAPGDVFVSGARGRKMEGVGEEDVGEASDRNDNFL